MTKTLLALLAMGLLLEPLIDFVRQLAGQRMGYRNPFVVDCVTFQKCQWEVLVIQSSGMT
jgi:hypothetical protein